MLFSLTTRQTYIMNNNILINCARDLRGTMQILILFGFFNKAVEMSGSLDYYTKGESDSNMGHSPPFEDKAK